MRFNAAGIKTFQNCHHVVIIQKCPKCTRCPRSFMCSFCYPFLMSSWPLLKRHSPHWWTFYMQNVHQMQTKLMNILHGECSSVRILCNPTDAIASKKVNIVVILMWHHFLFSIPTLNHLGWSWAILGWIGSGRSYNIINVIYW